ncbi:MAG: Flp pilus assembly protein CpaB [Endomicrobia bacterium]|nr:Flp pilus assembly protein CpaB [Endomicrobiia bacterium]MCL2507348.1 Flp pilus assembly protein CpaB [Endomicrobiia bacterium]
MKKTILLSVIFAVIAAFFAYVYLSGLETTYKQMSEPVNVVVAAQRITQGTVIQKNMLAEKNVPKEYAQPKVFGAIGNLFAKDWSPVYIALNTIEPGEQVLSTKVSKSGQETGISNIIPDGLKALAVNFDADSSLVITPGSRIDVLSIIEYSDKNREFHYSVFPVAQNILVLAVGNDYLGSAKRRNEESSSGRGILTLAVSVQEAQAILLAGEKGNLKYIIRPAGDETITDIKPLKMSDIVKDISKSSQQPDIKKSAAEKAISQSQKEALEMINKYVKGE